MEAGLPKFRDERQEADFWDTHSIADYRDQLEPEEVELAPELAAKAAERQKTKRITLRLRVSQIEAVKEIAKREEIPYQTLIRSWIAEAIRKEQGGLNDRSGPSHTRRNARGPGTAPRSGQGNNEEARCLPLR